MKLKEIINNKNTIYLIKILLFSIASIIIVLAVFLKNINKIKQLNFKEQNQEIQISLAKTPRSNYPKIDGIWSKLEVPSTKININVYRGSRDYLNYGALHHKESYFPGDNGTILILLSEDYIEALSKIKKNDEIKLNTLYGTYKYNVTKTSIKNKEAFSNETKISSNEEQLILYTSYPNIPGYKSERIVVYASLAGDSKWNIE